MYPSVGRTQPQQSKSLQLHKPKELSPKQERPIQPLGGKNVKWRVVLAGVGLTASRIAVARFCSSSGVRCVADDVPCVSVLLLLSVTLVLLLALLLLLSSLMLLSLLLPLPRLFLFPPLLSGSVLVELELLPEQLLPQVPSLAESCPPPLLLPNNSIYPRVRHKATLQRRQAAAATAATKAASSCAVGKNA